MNRTTEYRMCARCLYDESVPGIRFDEDFVCNYCNTHDQLEKEYPTGEAGRRKLEELAAVIKKDGRGKKYDVIVGVSGGCDSSYLLYQAVKLGLRPLAVHFDNTWNSTVAVENIHNVLKKLDVDLYTYVVDNKEYDDLYLSFLKAGVVDIDVQTDIALAATLYIAAEKYKVKYIFEGHSFRTEGLAPLGWVYMDGKYIESVQKEYGSYRLKTFPNLRLFNQLWWMAFLGIRKIRPLYYLDYVKKDAMKLLKEELDWQWYGGHHLENRWTAFTHTYFFPKRYQTDTRLLGHAALVRAGQISREEGIEAISKPQSFDPEIVEMVKKRLKISGDELDFFVNQPRKTYRDFRTYKRTFERLRPLVWLLYKLDRIPKSFYIKYTSPDPLPASR